MQYLKIVFALFVSIFLSCKQKHALTPAETLRQIMQADSTGDLDKVVSLYEEDAILIPSGRADIIGKNAIRENYRNIFANSIVQLKATANEIIDSGDWTVIRGSTNGNIISKKDSTVTVVDDKFLMMLKKQSGEWKIYRLMWSKNQPDSGD